MRNIDEHMSERATLQSSGGYGERDSGVEPIAIIGMSCRLPGEASDPKGLWELLASGKSAWSKVPKDRFNMDAFHDPSNPTAGTTNTAGGHFIEEDLAAFDADFFGMNPVELEALDPQQRLLMEIAYESFENAGLPMKQLWGSNTGVYVGQWSNDYDQNLARDTEFPALYHTIGAGPAISSNRLSYFFNLRGPSFTVDTGCSASLVALHSAVQSLRAGETDASFVGGVNLLLDPQRFSYQSKLKMFSAQGRSYSFDHRANGYGRGEGCCGLVLKRLSAAKRDGDPIRAVIRNSVLNQDGRTPGISVPSGLAQEQAIKAAYSGARLHDGPDFVEAHGTGTAVGDPIEVKAIAAAFATIKTRDGQPIPVGSVKGNVGHTESCAGLAGVIKAVLMLENQTIPPQANFERLNPSLLLDEWNLYVPTVLEQRELRRISVNSFGYGGTNAHVILDRADAPTDQKRDSIFLGLDSAPQPKRKRLLILSATSEEGCSKVAQSLVDYVDQRFDSAATEAWLDRLAYTVNRKSIHSHRTTILASDLEEMLHQLSRVVQVPTPARVDVKSPKVAYVFSGQGAQYYNMGRELINTWPVFTKSLQRANQQLNTLGCEWDLMAELSRDAESSNLDNPAFGQPASTAIQLALCDTLADLGVVPVSVAGHSSGEIAAAYAAHALSFENAMTVSYHRGRLTAALVSKQTSPAGAMLAVGTSPDVAQEYIDSIDGPSSRVTIACYNSPSSVTLSGDIEGIEKLQQMFENKKIFNRLLRTNGAAYHSHHMQQIEEEYRNALEGVEATTAKIPLISSVTGRDSGSEVFGRDYWVENLVSPVRFDEATAQLCQDISLILELGAHETLGGPIRQTLKTLGPDARDVRYLSCLKRKSDAASTLLTTIGEVFADGIHVDLHTANNGFDKKLPRPLSDLPRYPFDHSRRYWHESRVSKEYKHRKFLPHELLGNMSTDVNHLEPKWRRYLKLKEIPWLRNHVVQGQIVFPAAGYLSMALEAVRRYTLSADPEAKISSYAYRNISFGKALVLSDEKLDNEITLSLIPESRTAKESWHDWVEFRIHTVSAGKPWTEHCRGRIRAVLDDSNEDHIEATADKRVVEQALSQSVRFVSPSAFYNLSRQNGLDWHKPFDNLVKIRASRETSVTVTESPRLERDDSLHNDSPYVIHPGTLDTALFHCVCAIVYSQKKIDVPVVPSFISELVIAGNARHAPGTRLVSHAIEVDNGEAHDVVINSAVDGHDQFLIRARGMILAKLPGGTSRSGSRKLTHESTWVPYCQKLTTQHLDRICKKDLPDGSAVEQNDMLNSLTVAFCRAAIEKVSYEQVREGYQQHFYRWMKKIVDGSMLESTPEPFMNGHLTNGLTNGITSNGTKHIPNGLSNGISKHQVNGIANGLPQDASNHIAQKHPDASSLTPKENALKVLTNGLSKDLPNGVSGKHDEFEILKSSSASPGEAAVRRVGENAASILTGEIDPISLLLHDGLLPKMYAEFRNQRCYHQIKAYIAELGLQNPSLRIIEIGGGSASASLPILQACNRDGQSSIAKYDFTDISSGFFLDARKTLADYSEIVDFHVLDIEQDASQQGIEKGSYDIVIACNVIHATVDIDVSLANAKGLLRPNGRLILMEITNPQPYYSLIFGAFPGWWAGAESGRVESPLLRGEQWSEKLIKHGFVDTEPVFRDFEEKQGGTLGVFATTMAEDVSERKPIAHINIVGLPTAPNAWSATDLARVLGKSSEISYIDLNDKSALLAPLRDAVIFLPEICDALTKSITEESFEALQRQIIGSNIVLMLGRGGAIDPSLPNGSLTTGFARTIRLEHPKVRFITLDLDPQSPYESSLTVVNEVLRSPVTDLSKPSADLECEFAERNGQLFVSRVVAEEKAEHYIKNATGKSILHDRNFLSPRNAMRAGLGIVGLLETFHWKPDPGMDGPLGPDQVRVELRAASINFRDILVATGQVQSLTEMKNDCSGVVVESGENMKSRFKPGDRVCAYYGQSYSNFPVVDGDCCSRIPDSMSFEVAASVPIVWGTVYHSLVDIAHLAEGEKILIHSGAGAVGQAAIALAQHLGAEVFTTAGSDQKRAMLAEKFNLPNDHIFSSRNTHFKQGIKELTKGQGVDVILNSLTGEMTRASCEVLTDFGRFIEIGKKDLIDDALLPTKFLLRNITFACVDLTQIIEKRHKQARRLLEKVVDLLASDAVKATEITTYPISEIEHAFRFVASGKHIGKVILTVAQDEVVKAASAPPQLAQLQTDAVYIVVGGLGGLGRCVVPWLADRGARTIVTLSRSGASSEQATTLIEEMQSRGVSVVAKACDIGSKESLRGVVEDIKGSLSLPIRGLINSAMSLQDVTFKDMTHEQWQKSLLPKVQGTWNLHECLPKDLDFFISMSSIVAISGNLGQSNYGAACSFQDSFAAFRRAQGLSGYSINIGPVSDAGFVSENEQVNMGMERKGFSSVTIAEVLANLDYVVTSAGNRTQNSIGLLPARPDASRSTWLQNKRLIHLAQHSGPRGEGEGGKSDEAQDALEAVGNATTAEGAEAAVLTAILQQLSKLLMTPVEQLSPRRTLDSYGVDSLIAVELKNWIGTYLEADIPLLVLRETNDIQHLARLAAEESRLVSLA